MLTSSTWWQDVGNTLIITVVSVSLELVLGMLIAQAMYRAIFARAIRRRGAGAVRRGHGRRRVRLATRVRPDDGLRHALAGIDPPPLTTRSGSFILIIMAEVWKTTPFIALLLLGGLALVPEDLYKAAKVDGATALQRFFRITLPLIKPALMVAVLFRTLDAFRIYDVVYIMTAAPTTPRRCRSSAIGS